MDDDKIFGDDLIEDEIIPKKNPLADDDVADEEGEDAVESSDGDEEDEEDGI